MEATLNTPAIRDDDELILEGVVTSANEDGSTNVSPMGPVVDRNLTRLRLRPFDSSTTYRNLRRTGRGVFHITDDVDLLVRSALHLSCNPHLAELPGSGDKYLLDTCRWYAFAVTTIDDSNERVEVACSIVSRGSEREFLGWNRACHAVLEATILATRLHLLPPEQIQAELRQLKTIVDKTASRRERDAFQLVVDYVRSRETTNSQTAN